MAFKKGDRVLLVGAVKLHGIVGEDIGSHLGVVNTKKLAGKKEGIVIKSHLGKQFIAIKPTVIDIVTSMKRGPQVILPRDATEIISVTGVNKDSVVIDVGSGSGWLSVFLSSYVKQIYTFEKEKDFYDIAKSNIEKFSNGNVKIARRDVIARGFGKKGADLATIDLREPHKVIPHAFRSLSMGGWVFCHCPVIEQVKNVCKTLGKFRFSQIRILQNISQEWKANPTRPVKQDVGHTAFLVFGRKL